MILATGEKVVMEDSLSEALASLTGDATLVVRPPAGKKVAEGDESVTLSDGVGDFQSDFDLVGDTIEELKKGLTALEEALERLKTLTGGSRMTTDWKALESKYYMFCARRQPIVIVRGEGTNVWDDTGKEYLDFTSAGP